MNYSVCPFSRDLEHHISQHPSQI